MLSNPFGTSADQQHEYSLGSTKLMESVSRLLNQRDLQIDVVCLNLGTIVRNCHSNASVKAVIEFEKLHGIRSEKPSDILYKEAHAEMLKIIGDIIRMFNTYQVVQHPVLITYHSDYRKSIDEEVLRPERDSDWYLNTADRFVRQRLIKGNRKVGRNGMVQLIELPVNDRFPPWRHLMIELKDLRNHHNVLMISNHPVDYHLGSVSATFHIVRSFTGEVLKYRQLGKAVFGEPDMPFTLDTHALFGDKEDVKCSLSAGDRKELLKIAEKEEWILKTKDYIHDRLFKLKIRIPTTF